MRTDGPTLHQLTGGEYHDLPDVITGADAEEAARLLRAAACQLALSKFPLLALRHLWQMLMDPETSRAMRLDLLRQIGRRIERLATVGLGEEDAAIVQQVATMQLPAETQRQTQRGA